MYFPPSRLPLSPITWGRGDTHVHRVSVNNTYSFVFLFFLFILTGLPRVMLKHPKAPKYMLKDSPLTSPELNRAAALKIFVWTVPRYAASYGMLQQRHHGVFHFNRPIPCQPKTHESTQIYVK